MHSKIENAKSLIRKTLGSYSKPIVMSSFGKDSMVVLHILKTMDLNLPVLFHREPFEPQKYTFANSVIVAEGYVVYDYPPSLVKMAKNGDKIELVNFYQTSGKGDSIWLGTGIKEPVEGQPFLCGLEDVYNKPMGYFKFPWDLGFVGHKSCDTDPIYGDIPLKVDVKINEGACDYAYPLRHFTDSDVWEYTEKFNVAYDDRRYNKADGYTEFSDITYNPDYFHCCTRCMDKDSPEMVYCPKLKKQIANISNTISYAPPVKYTYIGK